MPISQRRSNKFRWLEDLNTQQEAGSSSFQHSGQNKPVQRFQLPAGAASLKQTQLQKGRCGAFTYQKGGSDGKPDDPPDEGNICVVPAPETDASRKPITAERSSSQHQAHHWVAGLIIGPAHSPILLSSTSKHEVAYDSPSVIVEIAGEDPDGDDGRWETWITKRG